MAASKTSARPANILLIEAPSTATLDDQLDAAVAAGADVVVGPLERNAVENIAARESLPLPTVALNIPSQAQSAPVPDNLIMMSVSTETEAKYIARLAVKALPAYSDRYGFPQIAILVSQGAWEQRIAETFQQELAAAHVNYNVITISEETLPTLQKSIEPKLTEEEELVYREKTAEARKHYAAGSTQLKRRIAAIQAERRAKIATTEPPYQHLCWHWMHKRQALFETGFLGKCASGLPPHLILAIREQAQLLLRLPTTLKMSFFPNAL